MRPFVAPAKAGAPFSFSKNWVPAFAGTTGRGLSLFIVILLLATAARAETPVIKIERGEACVAPVAEMRRDHPKMLFHQRDRTLRKGVRETRFSLKGCVECHASGKTGSVLGQEGFCSSCHTYAAVKIDCFECHTSERAKRAVAKP